MAQNDAKSTQQWRKVCFAFFAAQHLHIFCANKGTKKAHCFVGSELVEKLLMRATLHAAASTPRVERYARHYETSHCTLQ